MDQNQIPSPRTPLQLEVTFKKNYAREESKGLLRNISITGAFLEMPGHQLRAEEKIQLSFVVSGRERKIAAHVVWSNSAGCGVRFSPASQRDVQIIDDLIYFVENQRTDRRSVLDNIFKKVS